MTLCAAWIRHGQGDVGEELVFATDSRLNGGTDRWDAGIKLFDLGRSDCLVCFAGSTLRAYPLLLQGGNSGRFNAEWNNPRLDLLDVLDALCNLFTEVIGTINREVRGADILTGDDTVEFLFGGWSWRAQRFCIWKVHYVPEANGFIHTALHDSEAPRIFFFMGEGIDQAKGLLEDELKKNLTLEGSLMDMEPLRVLMTMSHDTEYHTISGPLQIAKVYRSGHNEFFGIVWPSMMNGKPTFLGRKINPFDAPPIRLINPDTLELLEGLPEHFQNLNQFDFGDMHDFVTRCYSGPSGSLKPLKSADQDRLKRFFKEMAYQNFVANCVQTEYSDEADDGGEISEEILNEQAIGDFVQVDAVNGEHL